MNRVISAAKMRLRQIVTIFLVVLTFLVSTALMYGNQLQAQAELVTPEATS